MSVNPSESLLNGLVPGAGPGADPGADEGGTSPELHEMRDQLLREYHISSGWLEFAAERLRVVLAGADCDAAVVSSVLEEYRRKELEFDASAKAS